MSIHPLISEQTSEEEAESLVQRVESYVNDKLETYLKELSHLCAIDSGTYNKAGVDLVGQYFADRMRDLGMQVTTYMNDEWGNDIYGVLKGKGKGTIVMLGHMDTVYPIGIGAARPLRVEGDIVYGPGVIDMKGCILSSIYALEALQALHFDDFNEIRLLCVSDEEISERHSTPIIWQSCQKAHGALVLEAARANGDLVSSRKGGSWYKLTARGHAAHAGVEPEKGANAILELAHQIIQFQSLNGMRKGITINVGRVSGGTAINVVPDHAEVSLDLRFEQNEDRIEVEQCWREMMKHTIVPGVELRLEIDPDSRDPMVCTDGNLNMVMLAQEITGELGFDVNHGPTGGISDANYASGFGLPALDGLGPVGGLDHSPNEYMEKSSIAPRTALLAGLIAHIGTHPETLA